MSATYVYDFSYGDKDQKDLLGGKGANLAEMTSLGLPVPPGFTITTEACRTYLAAGSEPPALRVQVTTALRLLEVFGNLGETSGTGAAFTRDPASGTSGAYGDYLTNAQGEDVVAGVRNTLSLEEMERLQPDAHKELRQVMRRLETHYRDLCDIEFKRTAGAAFRSPSSSSRRA